MVYITIIFLFLFAICFIKVNSAEELKIHNFDFAETLPLRGILAVCVLLCHLCPYIDGQAPLLADFSLWGPPSVATFFLLTGYGLAYSVKTKGPQYLNGFFYKRIMRLLSPLLIMTAIYQIYKYYSGTFSVVEMLKEPSPNSWFIYALMVWYIGFYACFRWAESTKGAVIRIWLFTVLYIAITVYFKMGYYYMSILPLPIAVTYVGYEEMAKKYLKTHVNKVLLVFTLVFVTVMSYSIIGACNILEVPMWGPPVYIVVPLCIVLITYILGGWKNKVTNFLGKISYEFYIVHGFIVKLLGGVCILDFCEYGNAFIIMMIVMMTTIVFAYGINKICSFSRAGFPLYKFNKEDNYGK